MSVKQWMNEGLNHHNYFDNIFCKFSGKVSGIGNGGFLTLVKMMICNKTPNFLGVNDSSISILHRL